MLTRNLARLIRQGFELELRRGADLPGRSSEPALARLDVWMIVRASRDPARTREQRGEVIAAVVRCYRRSPTSAWSAVLLELLSPTLVATTARFPYLPLGVSNEDIQQQVVVEALDAARHMRLPARPGLTAARLVRLAVRRTAHMLVTNARAEAESREDALLLELASVSETDALARLSRMLGVPARELAIEMGVSNSIPALSRRPRHQPRSLRRAA